jgi:hypothetical protein
MYKKIRTSIKYAVELELARKNLIIDTIIYAFVDLIENSTLSSQSSCHGSHYILTYYLLLCLLICKIICSEYNQLFLNLFSMISAEMSHW